VISKESFDVIMAFMDEAVATEWGPARERTALIRARGDLDRWFHRMRQQAVTVAEPDPAAARYAADVRLVADAIAHHTAEGLKAIPPITRPSPGDLWPTSTYALAQWHATRAHILTLAPVTVAATALREETLAALDTNPKDGS
jgi:hypothetical protein